MPSVPKWRNGAGGFQVGSSHWQETHNHEERQNVSCWYGWVGVCNLLSVLGIDIKNHMAMSFFSMFLHFTSFPSIPSCFFAHPQTNRQHCLAIFSCYCSWLTLNRWRGVRKSADAWKKKKIKNSQRSVFKIKSSFLAPFLVIVWSLVCNHQKWKKMSSYLKSQLYDNAIENFHTFLYIYRAVRLTDKAKEFNFFYCILH